MLDIEYLLSLNRLRDKIIEGIGDYKQVEICRNPHKLLKPHEEYVYELVPVHDNTLHDLNNIGIIDELVRMTFEDVDYEYQLKKVDNKKTTYGMYLRYRKINSDEENVHPFNLLFRSAEKVVLSKLSKSEKSFEEDYRSYARLLVFEVLCGKNDKFNKSFNNRFNLSFTVLDDVKSMLADYELAKHIKAYINKYIARQIVNDMYNGRNQDVLYTRKRKDNVECKETKYHNNISLDKNYNDEDSSDLHECINEGIYEDNHNSILDSDVELYGDTVVIEKGFEIYKYIFDNIEKIVTKPQLKYFNDCLNGDGYIYDSTTKSKYKKSIQSSIMGYFKDNKNITEISGKYRLIRNNLVDDLLFILDSLNNVQRLDKLVIVLKKDDYKSDFITKLIYEELDLKFRQPLTSLLLDKKIDKESYANNKFIYVLNLLQKHLLFLEVLNETDMFMFNKVEVDITEFEIKQYIESNILKDKSIGYLPTRAVNGYIPISELQEFLSSKLNENINGRNMREYLNKYKYDLSEKRCKRIDGYPAYEVYSC